MSGGINIVACENRRDWALFERLPEMLHGHLPHFIPPFPGSFTGFRKAGHPFHNHGELRPYIAYVNGEPAGRIASVVNRTHNEYHKDRVGFFGFFDFVDDDAIARALLDRAESDLMKRGFEVLRGPFSPTQNDECGLLVEGFDKDPYVLMPYNPEYYVPIYRALGLQPARDLYSYYAERGDEDQVLERIGKVVERVKSKTNITFRTPDLKQLPKELAILRHVWNETLCRNWNFMPLSKEDLDYATNDLRQILDSDVMVWAELDGEPVGVSLTIPNVNEFMQTARSSRGLVRLLKLAWLVKTKKPRGVRLAVLGVLPQYRSKGVSAAFFFEALKRGIARYHNVELGWVQDDNEEVIKLATSLGARHYKTHRIFEKPIATPD